MTQRRGRAVREGAGGAAVHRPGCSVAVGERGGVTVWILAFVATAGVGLGALIGIGCAIGANACPFGEDAPPAATGEQVWRTECAVCHGIGGTGSAANHNAPSLVSGPKASLTLDELVSAVNDGSPGLMPRYEGKLTETQIDAVARYVVALREEGS